MRVTNVAEYIDYFRQIAVNNVFLQHNPASEMGSAPAESKHFARWSADEVLTGLRTKMSFPALLVELYETDTEATDVNDVNGKYSGAFSILQSALMENYTSEEAAYVLAEKIMLDVLRTIWNDHYGEEADRCEAPFEYFSFDKMNITPVGPIYNNQFGYRVLFGFRMSDNKKFTMLPATSAADGFPYTLPITFK